MSVRPPRIFINGFGRIGRSVLRLLHTTRGQEGFDLVGVNDIAPRASCAYLFQYDSVFGPFPGTITHDETSLSVNATRILSTASCTTHALAPLLKLLDDEWGVVSGHMTTVHCYTGSQPTIDKPRDDLARSRAAALSMVPTTTSAGQLIGEVLPNLKGRIEARAIRVPTASESAVDLTLQTGQPVTVAQVNAHLQSHATKSPLLGWITQPLVSTDLRGRPESLILSGAETSVSVGGLLRLFGWYDNEWGFSNRLLDMAHLIARRNCDSDEARPKSLSVQATHNLIPSL